MWSYLSTRLAMNRLYSTDCNSFVSRVSILDHFIHSQLRLLWPVSVDCLSLPVTSASSFGSGGAQSHTDRHSSAVFAFSRHLLHVLAFDQKIQAQQFFKAFFTRNEFSCKNISSVKPWARLTGKAISRMWITLTWPIFKLLHFVTRE